LLYWFCVFESSLYVFDVYVFGAVVATAAQSTVTCTGGSALTVDAGTAAVTCTITPKTASSAVTTETSARLFVVLTGANAGTVSGIIESGYASSFTFTYVFSFAFDHFLSPAPLFVFAGTLLLRW
jgi:hypothetical protein